MVLLAQRCCVEVVLNSLLTRSTARPAAPAMEADAEEVNLQDGSVESFGQSGPRRGNAYDDEGGHGHGGHPGMQQTQCATQ